MSLITRVIDNDVRKLDIDLFEVRVADYSLNFERIKIEDKEVTLQKPVLSLILEGMNSPLVFHGNEAVVIYDQWIKYNQSEGNTKESNNEETITLPSVSKENISDKSTEALTALVKGLIDGALAEKADEKISSQQSMKSE